MVKLLRVQGTTEHGYRKSFGLRAFSNTSIVCFVLRYVLPLTIAALGGLCFIRSGFRYAFGY
jgi:hypothetical protein